MGRSAYMLEIARGVRGSLGRFLAILGIVALGCGFYAGLRMCGPDMRIAADRWYDGCALWDLRVVSSQGLDDAAVARLRKVDGVEAAMPARTVDVMAEAAGKSVAVRVSSVDADAARASRASGPFAVKSSKDDYLNRARLASGRWPRAAGECVASADSTTSPLRVGDVVRVTSSAGDVDSVLVRRTLTVVGTVSSPDYPYTGSFGTTTLGDGTIGQYVYVTDATFSKDVPYTAAYLAVEGARGLESGSSAYERRVDAVAGRVRRTAVAAARERFQGLKADARAQVDAKARELEAQRQAAATPDAVVPAEIAPAAAAQAQDGLAAAQRQIDEAQAKVDAMQGPEVYVLDRTQSEGAATYQADTERMDHIAAVFPAMFFLVAALVALTTMARMVEDDRQKIGTHKALGYGRACIAAMYLAYALLAAGAGAVLGIAVLSQALPLIVTGAYGIIYAVPSLGLPLPVSSGIALSSGGLGVGVTLAATWIAVASTLRETPAALMLPRAPKAGRRILLERVGPLWRRLSFSWKVTFRNLFRYKRRLLMTVVGIAGCSALLLVGFGLHDSIWDIIDRQFGPIIRYDTTVGMDADAAEKDVDAVAARLRDAGARRVERVERRTMLTRGKGGSASATEKTRVSVMVPRSAAGLSRCVGMRDRETGEAVAFGDDSVLVTEKLASLYGIRAGQRIVLFGQDDAGNAKGGGVELTVDGIVENYVGNVVYVGRSAWRRVEEGDPSFSTVLADVRGGTSAQKRLADELHDMDGVATVAFSSETIETYRHMLSVVNMVVVVLIVSAGALAFIVLYNLTNINVSERVREIASLKVLGFTRREVHAYVFREIVLLSLLGDAAGMALGTWLEGFVITTAEVDYVMFGREIHPLSFVLAFALTMAFTLAILLLMRRRLDAVDMVESLKSVD